MAHKFSLLKKTCRLWLCLFGLLLLSQASYATNAFLNDATLYTVDYSQLQSSGYITVKMPIYRAVGVDQAAGISYFYVNGTACLSYYSSCDAGGVNADCWQPDGQPAYAAYVRMESGAAAIVAQNLYPSGDQNLPSTTYWYGYNFASQYLESSVNDGAYAQFQIYLLPSLLQAGHLNFTWSVQYDENSDGKNFLSVLIPGTSANVSYSGPATPTYTLSNTHAGAYDVTFNAPSSNNGRYIWDVNTIGASANVSKGSTVTTQFPASDAQQTHTLYYWLVISSSQSLPYTTTVTLPAYPMPKNITGSYNNSIGTVTLNWTMATANATGTFSIQRASKADFSDATTITSTLPVSATSYTDDISALNVNGTLYYRIHRNDDPATWGWTNGTNSASCSLTVAMTHQIIATDMAVLLTGQRTAVVSWTLTPGIWSTGSKVMINRVNYTNGGSKVPITVPADSLKNKRYTDVLPVACNAYYYEVYVQPGATAYPVQSPGIITETVVPVEMGDVGTLAASKGYFSDRVELAWNTVNGSLDEFTVLRREYNSGDTSYTQVDRVTASPSSTYYTDVDTRAVPGVVYEYKIVGIRSCGGNTELTETQPTSVGFRTPTGDIYGRVAFANGQAEEGVEISVTTDPPIVTNSLKLASGATATISNINLLAKNATAATLQAWVAPSATTGTQKVISKAGMYELGIDNDLFYFKAGSTTLHTDTLTVSSTLAASRYVHMTGVYSGDSVKIYINGAQIAKAAAGTVTGNSNPMLLGGGVFAGNIDEVRIWSAALNAATIKRDYNRYLTGGETGLIAYYTFNYATSKEFYDVSYSGTTYNASHGTLSAGMSLSDTIPSADQLGYKGVTLADGSYSIRAIPYTGNGTAYNLTPRLGIHQFEAQTEVRFISASTQSFTVNFTDKSSFNVSGTVKYANTNIPVQGVNFQIDGKPALQSNGSAVGSAADGSFTISVPVGVHEVMAVKSNHVFVNGGRITDRPGGQDLNYQDAKTGVAFQDSTTVKFIGRVAGGTIQEAYPVGHSLSKENLADGITVTLLYANNAYSFTPGTTTPRTVTETHFIPSNQTKAHTNTVDYGGSIGNSITIHVNDTTGEFVAHVIPELYSAVTVNVPGYDSKSISNSGQQLDLSQMYFAWQNSAFAYTDSVPTGKNNQKQAVSYSDTVNYQVMKKFIARNTPQIRVTQTDINNKALPYFGSDTVSLTNITGATTKAPLVSVSGNTFSGYIFGKPVFQQNASYTLKLELFEEYLHYNNSGTPDGKTDNVPTQDATFQFNNGLATTAGQQAAVAGDSLGTAYYTFTAGDPELTSAWKQLALSVTYGNQSSPTSIKWTPSANFLNGEAYILGGIQKGTDFVTAGPDRILTVLRDPPGSESYSYLEKGVTFNESSTYSGSLENEGSEQFTTGVKQSQAIWTGVGAGSSTTTTEIADGTTIGVVHAEQYAGQDTKSSSTTTTTRFQTGATPDYVGAEADVYIGYSTNITVGSTDNVSILSKADFDAAGGTAYYPTVYSNTGNWVLLRNTGISMNQSFNTLFAYPQSHIEQVVIPGLQALRNKLLLPIGTVDTTALRNDVTAHSDNIYYVSYFDASDPNFGKSNDDSTLTSFRGQTNHGKKWTATQKSSFDGPSYKIIYNINTKKSAMDTISFVNQSIAAWVARMADNEKQKVTATKLQQNYSFTGGSSVEYSESYSGGRSTENSFSINVGAHLNTDFNVAVFGVMTKLVIDETVTTTQGGDFASETERSHCKGFVLQEDGTDYLSTDVLYEPDWTASKDAYGGSLPAGSVNTGSVNEKDYYPTFIFRTRGGATSCPYENAYVTKYYQPGTLIDAATLQKEVPYMDMPTKFLENVPSGETGAFTLLLRNNSQSNDDAWYNLKIINSSNPNGARMFVDGAAIGNGLEFMVPAGQTLIKTLEVGKGTVMNYDNLQLILQSQCEDNITDTVTFSIHFTPSCSNVNISKPNNNWTYNTKLPTINRGGVDEHYMEVTMNGFNVNYDNFNRIELQYKSAAQSDNEWSTLMNYYNDTTLYNAAVKNGMNAAMVQPSDAGSIHYNLFLDNMPDQMYNLRAVSVCAINNVEVTNTSAVVTGIKDMYCPRLFGTAQPANGILGVGDQIQLTFNEPIAQGLLIKDNIQVRGVRNGTISDHSTSVRFDGLSNYMDTEFDKNLQGKNLTVEMWIQPDKLQDATLFGHGNINESLELSLTSDGCMAVKIGSTTVKSPKLGQTPANPNYADGSWAHVALVYNAAANTISAYYNFTTVISNVPVSAPYTGVGNIVLGKSSSGNGNSYSGKMQNVRVWEKVVSTTDLQLNSLVQLAGIEEGLMAYYPMDEGRGTLCTDKARGATLTQHGTVWALPDGFAVKMNGSSYLKMDAGSAAFTKEMDYTIELWFKAEAGQTNTTILSAGSGEAGSVSPDFGFSIGFNAQGQLSFTSDSVKTVVAGDYRDNAWHHFAVSVDRTNGKAQIYMDGALTNYIAAANVGGIASDFFYLGARGWHSVSAPTTLKIDNYFRGSVDDVRFWQLYRSEKMVHDNNNMKLTGKELGLVHYYPFDADTSYMGINSVVFTNKDMHISNTANPDVDKFVVVGAEVTSKDIAPIKDSGPVANLDFDFVTNNDALIITLKEPEYKITRTIVTFTVQDVRDLNGNSLVSPITWSAYIDRNQLVWETDRMDISKPVFQPYQFTVKVLNNGGSIMNYTINNIPSWLTVTPTSGTLNPLSYNTVAFTINEGLNVGTYNEVIYLTNENNVSEPLALNVTVNGTKPDWSVNPADFKYNMSVFGKMRFNNIFSSNSQDMLAAFDKNGKCIGVTNNVYNQPLDMWYALLTVYNNNKTDDGIEFRIWQANTGKIYKATPDRPITFINNSVVGDVSNPVIFDGSGTVYGNIPLNTGWNWISFNLHNDDLLNVDKTMVNGIWTQNDVVKNKDFFASYSEKDNNWVGSLSGFNNASMYIVHSSYNQNMDVSGSIIDPKSSDAKITVQNGWNYIGYIPLVNMSVKEALAGYDAQKGDIIKSQTDFAMYSSNQWVGSLGFMEPGKGYMLLRTANNGATFNYPAASTMLNNNTAPMAQANYHASFANNMVIVATTTEGIQPGDRINAYVNDELRGTGEYVASNDSVWSFITVSGDEQAGNIHFELERSGKIIGTANNLVNYSVNGVTGSVERPLVLDFRTPANKVTVYPNPFRDKLFVLVSSSANDIVQLTLCDVTGRQLLKEVKHVESGVNQIEINGSSLITGIYILHVTSNGAMSTFKVEKK